CNDLRLVHNGKSGDRGLGIWWGFQVVLLGEDGNAENGGSRGPYYEDLDLSFAKVFPITERQHLQTRFEMFNAGSTWHRGAWMPCASLPNCGNTPLGSLVPTQNPVVVSPSEWARDNLWQGLTFQLGAVIPSNWAASFGWTPQWWPQSAVSLDPTGAQASILN